MYGPILSVMLMGLIPVWENQEIPSVLRDVRVAVPIVTAGREPLELPRLSASGIIIMDLDSAQTLHADGADTPRPMASLTKLMTALVIAENHDMEEWLKVPSSAASVSGSLAHLVAGQEFRVGDVMKGLILNSGNDAAVALAQFHSGSVNAFVQEMNARARQLGLKATSFANPIGLDDAEQYSTARDLGWLAMFVLRRDEIRERMAMRSAEIRSRAGQRIGLSHTHLLLGQNQAVVAGKTGTTDDAKQCLLSIVEVGGRRFVVVLLHSADRYRDMRAVVSALASAES